MVAEVESEPRKAGDRGPGIPILTQLMARNMYLNDCLPYKAISDKTGIPEMTLQRMASKQGWTACRRAMKERLIQKADARGDSMRTELVEAIASQSEELALSGLNEARKELTSGSEFAARNFQSWSGGVKNFVQVARAIRDPGQLSSEAPRDFNLFLFVGQAGKAEAEKPTEKPAEVIDVK